MENPNEITQKMFEATNMVTLLSEAFESLNQIALERSNFNIWTLRKHIRGFYDFDPFPNWKGRKVRVPSHPLWGEGTIQAVKKVGNWYIPGVEFDRSIHGGHSLDLRDDGDQGREGCCQWIWFHNLDFGYLE